VVTNEFLAFDLGAESGRAMRASLRNGTLAVSEVYRFPNGPVRDNGSLRWDMARVTREFQSAFERVSNVRFESVGTDGWGCDYGLIGPGGSLVEPPYAYRDSRTDGMMEQVFAKVPRQRIYAITGVQFLWFNTLYQLYAACKMTPAVIAAAERLGTIPDLLNHWLSGELRAEYTNATTTQCIDAASRTWSHALLGELGIPTRLFPELVEAGSVLGRIRKEVSAAHADTPVVAPACHDTASAFASVEANNGGALLSSGTWSLLGTELDAPIVTPEALDLDFTNEGGVCGTIRVLKNITGLWLLQSCRRSWAASGRSYGYDELVSAAESASAFQALLDPDSPGFRNPENMLSAIDDYCRRTGQQEPSTPAAFSRSILESLALKYRAVLESLEAITGRRFAHIRVVGGGSRNRLLNQFTANATGRPVIAGPVEATALGNVAMQMLATGHVSSLDEARRIIDRSFPVERFEPVAVEQWDVHYRRFQGYVELTCA
jgi:rhamnulokinase